MTALMPAGLVTIKEPDRKGIMRNVLYWSDDGTPAGNLTPVEYDGGNVAATSTPLTSGSVTYRVAQ